MEVCNPFCGSLSLKTGAVGTWHRGPATTEERSCLGMRGSISQKWWAMAATRVMSREGKKLGHIPGEHNVWRDKFGRRSETSGPGGDRRQGLHVPRIIDGRHWFR